METIKEEKKADLEQLLNSLIERGWKPYGIDKDDIEVCEYDKKRKKISIGYMDWETPSKGDYDWLFISLRELVSKESRLWQFCIKNGLVEVDNHILTLWEKKYKASGVESVYKNDIHFEKEFEYRLIESSLKDESELEDFLLSNIKVEG